MQDNGKDELHFEIFRVPNWTSVVLKEARKLEQKEHCMVRVPILPSVHNKMDMIKILKLNTKFTYQKCVYWFTQLDRIDKIYENGWNN